MARNPIEMERWRVRFLVLGMLVMLGLLLLDLHSNLSASGMASEKRLVDYCHGANYEDGCAAPAKDGPVQILPEHA